MKEQKTVDIATFKKFYFFSLKSTKFIFLFLIWNNVIIGMFFFLFLPFSLGNIFNFYLSEYNLTKNKKKRHKKKKKNKQKTKK